MEESGFSVKKEVPPATASSFATENTENALRNTEGGAYGRKFHGEYEKTEKWFFPNSL